MVKVNKAKNMANVSVKVLTKSHSVEDVYNVEHLEKLVWKCQVASPVLTLVET